MTKASGKYLGTAVDQDMKDTAALKVLKNIKYFGMLTPGNAMKVRLLCYQQIAHKLLLTQ